MVGLPVENVHDGGISLSEVKSMSKNGSGTATTHYLSTDTLFCLPYRLMVSCT